MNIPVTLFFWLSALLPVLSLFVCITLLKISASKSACIGMVLTGAVAVLIYRMDPAGLLIEGGKGAWNALTILLVIWPAIFIYELTDEVNGFGSIRNGIQSLTGHQLMQIIILGWIFPDFLQGITGFGVAVAVGAPLLVSIGVKPFWGIIIVLLCYSWGATFGTLGLAWDALLDQAGVSAGEAGEAVVLAALLIGGFIFLVSLCLCWFYGKDKALKEGLPAVLILAVIQAGGQLVLAPLNASVACFLPSTVALAAAIGLTRTKRYHRDWALKESPIMEYSGPQPCEEVPLTFHQGFFSFYVLTLLTIVCLLVPPVNCFLAQWRFAFSFGAVTTGYQYVTPAEPFYSPMSLLTYAGTILAESCIASWIYFGRKGLIQGSDFVPIFKRTARKALPSTAAILGFVIMARYMSSSGQIYVLSQGIVNVLGRWYIVAAPLFGIIGTFITSSNMSSNILFGKFQQMAAGLLGLSPAVTLALQTFGGAAGAAMAPGSIILGLSTTGVQGKEGEILKRIMPVCVGAGLLSGVLVFIFY